MRMIGTIWSILEVFFYRLKFCDDFLNIYVEGEGGMLSHFISHIVNNFFPYWYFKNNSLPLSSLLKKFFNAQIYLPKLFRFLKRTCQFSGENSVCILQYLYFKHIENFKHIYKSRWNKKKKTTKYPVPQLPVLFHSYPNPLPLTQFSLFWRKSDRAFHS